MSRPTAGMSSHKLVSLLKRAGWGNLAGPEFRGVRGVYRALIEALDEKSGQGKATVWQIADQAGYSERWTGRCLLVLEELELIEWHRGGVVAGKPVPSWFRVSKQALLILVSIARTANEKRRTERDTQTRERISRYGLRQTRRKHQKPRSNHPALGSHLLSIEEVPKGNRPRSEAIPATKKGRTAALATMRAALLSGRGASRAPIREAKSATTTRSAKRDPARPYAPSPHTDASLTGGITQ